MAEKKSRTPFILAGCGCASFILAMILFGAAYWTTHHRSAADLVTYRNTREGRTGELADNYVGFEFAYPKSWTRKPDDPSNFVAVEHAVDGKTWENLNVGYYKTAGSHEGNEMLNSQLIAQIGDQIGGQFGGMRKLHEGKTAVGTYEGYEGLFTATVNGVDVYMRAILLPTPDAKKGVVLVMMGTSNSPDLKSAEDLGKKGDLPQILGSFKFTE